MRLWRKEGPSSEPASVRARGGLTRNRHEHVRVGLFPAIHGLQHSWSPPPQTLTRVLTLRPTCGGRDKQAQDLLYPRQGVSKARDGLRQAHTDVLVASPCRGYNRTCKACLLLPLPLRQRRIYGPLPFCNFNVVVNVGCSHIYGLFLVTCHLAWMNSAQRLAYQANVISVTAPCQSQPLPVYPCLPSC